jgi:hypothetical protein
MLENLTLAREHSQPLKQWKKPNRQTTPKAEGAGDMKMLTTQTKMAGAVG